MDAPKEKVCDDADGSAVLLPEGYAVLETQAVETHIITVNSPEQAIEMAKQLAADGFGAIEVCGAFGEELARRMYEATGKTVSVGYIVCPEDEKELSDHFWAQ